MSGSNVGFKVITALSLGNLADNANIQGRVTGAHWLLGKSGNDPMVIANLTGKDLLLDIWLELAAAAGNWTANGTINLFKFSTPDDPGNPGNPLTTLWPAAANNPTTSEPPGQYAEAPFIVTRIAETGARVLLARGIVLTPGHHRFMAGNNTGQTLAASNNRASYQTYTEAGLA